MALITSIDFSEYAPRHRRELEEAILGPEWQAVLKKPERIGAARDGMIRPSEARSPEGDAIAQLRALNEGRVKAMIREGCQDREKLLGTLGSWPQEWPEGFRPRFTFLGLCLTMRCNLKCRYCNQRFVEESPDPAFWFQAVDEATQEGKLAGTLVYITGGEPMLWGERLYGEDGLIRYAAGRGAVVNINTNATLITPEAALNLVSSGLARIHISLDAHDPAIQNDLIPGYPIFEEILKGIDNLQIARDLLGVSHPKIHINCVLTRRNLDDFPNLLRLLMDRKKNRHNARDEAACNNFQSDELGIHAIPVGGAENEVIRPTQADYMRFFTKVWEETSRVWDEIQAEAGIPADQRIPMASQFYITNPYVRVTHRGTLEEYTAQAARGVYSRQGLTERCYIAPTQAFILPDGSQYWCGAHSNSRPLPVGNAREVSASENILASIAQLSGIPNDFCRNCATATVGINQRAEGAMRSLVEGWVEEGGAD
ncbi:MAG: radical SAM protein [Armatimonadetes bacterium]|nr:radical SAM protein [Armatimonadota bacterium]